MEDIPQPEPVYVPLGTTPPLPEGEPPPASQAAATQTTTAPTTTTTTTISTPSSNTPSTSTSGGTTTITATSGGTATRPTVPVPNIQVTDQIIERCVALASWGHNITNKGSDCKTTRERRAQMTRYTPLLTRVSYDVNVITPHESVVESTSNYETGLTNDTFVVSDGYNDCTAVPRLFTPSIRGAGEICDAIAQAQYNSFHLYNSKKMAPAFLAGCSSGVAFGSKKEKKYALKLCFSDSSRVDNLIKDFESLRNNAFDGFVRALEEKSPVNAALSAWVCGRASADMILLRKNKLKHGPLKKVSALGLFNNDGTATAYAEPSDYVSEISKRSKNTRMAFDTASRVFDVSIRRILSKFISTAKKDKSTLTKESLGVYLRQTRMGTRAGAVGAEIENIECQGILTPRAPQVLKDEQEKRSNDTKFTKAAIMLDEEVNEIGNRRKRKASEDFDVSMAKDIIGSSPTVKGGITNQTEWSMHITQLVAKAFLETMSSLLACSFGVVDPLSEEGMGTVKNILVKNFGDLNSKRVEENAASAAIEYFVKIGNFSIPFVASDPYDIVEGRRVSPNTPVIFIVSRTPAPKDPSKFNTIFSLRDRLLVKDDFMNKALESENVNKAATHLDVRTPIVGGSLPIIRGPHFGDKSSSIRDAKEGISIDWYVNMSNMCATGKTTAAVASGIARALSSANVTSSKTASKLPEEKRMLESLRRNVDRSKNMLYAMGQSLSSWGYEEHNATVNSYWSSVSTARSFAAQEALNRGNDIGVRYQLDKGCIRDSFVDAETNMRASFFDAVYRPGDSILNLGDVVSSMSSNASDASWKRFVDAMDALPSAARRVFNIKELLHAASKFKSTFGKYKRNKHILKNVGAAVKIIKGLIEMTLQSAFNVSSLEEAGSVADGWVFNNQFEPSRMKAIEDLSGARNRRDVVTVMLNQECGSVKFSDKRRRGSSHKRTDVLVIPLVILEHLVADKVVLDGIASASNKTLASVLENFIAVITGEDTKLFTNRNTFMRLVRYIWFNMAILSLTDSNIISAINMARRDLGDSIYRDYLAIRSLLNQYGDRASKFSIGKIVESYRGDGKKTSSCVDTNKITTDKDLNAILKQLTEATEVFSGEKEANSKGVKAISDKNAVNNAVVKVNLVDVIGEDGRNKLIGFLKMVKTAVKTSLDLNLVLKQASVSNNVPDPTNEIIKQLKAEGPAKNKPTERDNTIKINLNSLLKESMINGIKRLIARLNNEPEANTAYIQALERDVTALNGGDCKRLITEYFIPKGVTPKAAASVIAALNENYPHLDLLSKAVDVVLNTLNNNNTSPPSSTISVKMSDIKNLLKHGLAVSFACLINPRGSDFNLCGADLLSTILVNFSAEASLALSRLQNTFSPIHPGLLAFHDTIKPSKAEFETMTEEFIKSVIGKIEEDSAPLLSRCDDSKMAKSLADAGVNYNDSIDSSSSTTLTQYLKNPTDLWNKYALAHFDTAIVPKFATASGLFNADLVKLSAYWQGMAKLPAEAEPDKWRSTLIGGMSDLSRIPGMSNVCTFNSALDTLLANPENSCGLISREITRNSAKLAHDIGSADTLEEMKNVLKRGQVSVLPNSRDAVSGNDQQPFDIFKNSTSERYKSVTSSLGILSERFSETLSTASSSKNDLVNTTIRSLPSFRQNIVNATRSLFEAAAVCNLLSLKDDVKVASKKIINIIKTQSNIVGEIGISRIAGLVSSVTTYKQYRKFLAFVDEKRRTLMRKAALNYNKSCGLNADSMYVTLAAINPSYPGKMEHLPDRFWLEVFEDCDGFVEGPNTSTNAFTSKLNSYAAVAAKVDRSNSQSLKADIEARRNQVAAKMSELEDFVIAAARTDLKEDSDVALSNVMKAQRLLARMNMAVEARRNDSVVFLSNRGQTPTASNVIDGVFSEMVSGPEGKDAGSLFLASKILAAKEIVKHSPTQKSIEMSLAAAGVDSYAYKLADLICQRMDATDIGLFMGGTMFQRGLFTTFLLNNILARQISSELKTDDLSEDTKKLMVNLVEFCSKIKRAIITMRNNKGHSIRRYNNAKKHKKTITDDMRADWAFASSVYSAFKTLRNNTSFETRTSNFIDMLGGNAFGGARAVSTRLKRNSTLDDVLKAGTTLNRSFFSNYCEKTAANKVVRTANIRMYRALKMRKNQNPGILACFDSGKLFSKSVEGGIHATGGMSEFCQDEEYDMLIDECEDAMDISSDSSSESEEDTSDWSSSDSEYDDDGVSERNRDALETLDSLAVPLGKLYACGEDYNDDFSSTFDTNLGRLVGRIDSDDDDESDESDEDFPLNNNSTRRAHKIVYGAGFLSSGPRPIYNNPRKLAKFVSGKKARYEISSSSDYTSDSDSDDIRPVDRLRRRSKSEQMKFMKRGLRQFVPKDITFDEKDEITGINYISQDKASGFLLRYGSSNPADRKYMREKNNIAYDEPSNGTRIQRVNFRRNLVKSAAAIVKTLKNNTNVIYSALFDEPAVGTITAANVASKLLFEDKLKSIVDKRNDFIKTASAAASTLFSCEDDSTAISSGKGYLTTPMEKLALCLKKKPEDTAVMSVEDVTADKSKTHLDWLNTVSTVFARSFNVSTGYALDEVFKVTKVLKSMYDSFETIIKSTEGAKEKVKSSLLSDIFNTRMVHTNAIMGLFLPTAFLNYQIMGKNRLESNEIEMGLLTLVRGINSRQLTTEDLCGSTDMLLKRLMSPKIAGPAGSRGGLSLFRMSLTDTIMGNGRPNEGGRVKGAVSLEVRSGGPVGGITIEDYIFAKKCKGLVDFCKEQSILLGNASGPLYRFATGVKDIKQELALSFTPLEGEVADDILANRLIASETDEKRGDFMRLSAHGNLYGCFDIISRLARKTIEMKKAIETMLDEESKTTGERVKALLDDLRNKRVKALKTPYGKRSIVLENNAFPSFSDNVLFKSRVFLSSVASLTNEVTKQLSLEFNKLSLKSFERVLENSAILANTKSTLRNLENRLQAAIVELSQFKHIRDYGLTTPRRVIDTTAKRLCTLTPDKETDWLLDDTFIKFAVDSELFNLKEAKANISKALRVVHIQHMTLLNMINTAISTEDSNSIASTTSKTEEKKNNNKQMEISACGKYVVHPSTGLLVKIEEGDITGSCSDGIESIHRQVALKVLERIDRNRNNLIRNKLYAMRTGRGDLRAIMSFNADDVKNTDSLVKALGTALANSAAITKPITPQQYQQQQQQQSTANKLFAGSVLPIRKAMSYIPVALENKHSPSPSCADTGSAPSSTVSLLSDGERDTTYRFMDQQEAHDLATILNIRSKHMGDYNQASLVALFNRSQKARADISLGNEKASASPSKQLFENISRTTAAITTPPSAINDSKGNGKRVSDYVSKIASSLSDTPEYVEIIKISNDMASALSVSSNVVTRQFITNPSQEGHHPKTDYDTITALSEMIQLKTTAIERYVKLLSTMSSYSNDPSMASSLRPSYTPIISTIETGAIDSSVVRNLSPNISSPPSTVDMMGKIEAAFQGGNPVEVINRETDIRRTLLMHYDPFLNKIQNTLKMITEYFANIEKIREVVKEEVKRISAEQIRKVEKSLKASEQDAVPVYERGVEMHKEEVNAINTEISVLRTKITEIESVLDEYSAALESLTNKFSTGTNEVPVDDLMSVSDSSQRQSRMIEDLSDFAKKHAGVVYDPEVEESSKTENMMTIKDDIAKGQNGVRVSYDDVLSRFPNIIKDDMRSVEDIKIFMSNLRLTTAAMGDYVFLLRNRIRLLEERASTSSADAASIEERIGSSKLLLQNQLVEQRNAIEKYIGLSASTINHTLAGEVVQVETLNFIDIQVERLLANAKRGDTPATVNETAAPGEEGSTLVNSNSNAETIDKLAADVEGNSFACQLKPLHDVIDRMMDMYRQKGTSIVSSKVDLQLASIFDMSTAVLGKSSHPEHKPSNIVPGLCRLCSMMITNLHEEVHTSDHAFEFDALRSTETLRRMLSAVISKDSADANVRYDTLSMLESHNGYIKELKFKKKQNVACLTPINTLLGAYDNMTIQPGTVLIPSSELFACDGLDHDKFRAMVHRSSDPSLADSSKSADSIVEMYASSNPNAEMLFFTHKDERRFFNSIPDCIIENMSDKASSVYNTHCSQSAVREDPKTGVPVFVGRLNRPSTITTSSKPVKSKPGNGGVPTHCTDTVNMSARYMVAPGSTLNAKKEEMMRLSRISDVNNIMYCDFDVNVSGSNNAWRIGEIVKAACGGNDMLMEKARKMLLLGSVTTLAQQKASSRVNDPSTLLQTNSVVEQYVSGETVSAEDLIVKMSYQQRFFPEMCNHSSRFIASTAAAANSEVVCPGDLLGDYKRFKTALNRHDNGCGVFLNSMSGVPTSSTQQGVLDTVVQSQLIREKNSLAVQAMTDSTVDMVSAVSSGAWKNANLFMPSTVITGKPFTRERSDKLKWALAGVVNNAHKLDRLGGVGGITSLSAIFGNGKGGVGFASAASAVADGHRESERLFNMILGVAASSSPSSLSTKEDVFNHRSLVSSILDISDKEMTDTVRIIEESIDKSRLEKAISEIKRNVLATSSSPITSSRASPSLSAILKASDIRQGRLSSSVMESGEDAVRAIDIFKTSPLLVRHTALFHPFSPLSLSSQTRDMLAKRTKSTTTANNLLSESMPILSDVFLCNTRDTPAERAIDRMLLIAYITKQAKHFDDVCSSIPVAVTGVTHNMLSAIDHKSSRLISNLKLHVNDTTSILMNIERFEKLSGRYGDEYAMSNRQNCNCPFELHHDFRPSADESLVRSFAYARPEVTIDEIRDTPYLCHRALSNKHFIMDATKVDPRVSGAALYRKVSAWAEMHNNVSYTGAFEPSRMALANSNFSTAGVNLDVIVRPNNASGVLGVLRCHRKHLCVADLKVTVASSMPSVFNDCNSEKTTSELIQNALPHNKYIQKSRLNASSIIFANILDKIIKDLGVDISKGLSHKLLNGEHSVPETVLEETNTIMDKLLNSVTVSGTKMSSSTEEASSVAEATMLTGNIASNYARNALKEAISEELKGSAENVPFSSAADGSVAFDFLMSKDKETGTVGSNGGASSSDKTLIAVLFEAIANKIGDKDFGRILDGIDDKINDFNTTDALDKLPTEAKNKWHRGQQELRRLLSFLRILKDNITPSLTSGKLGEDVKLYISLISAKSRLENVLRYGLSNSSSVDLSHLKPLNPTAVSKNIEDTFTYRNVPPIFIMALPDNFSALFQQEQRDPEYIIDSRRSITSLLNHPNTRSMANAARASVGPGGGSSMGIYPSALLLQESSVVTAEPVVDAKTSPPTMYETSVTKSPLMIVDPFKPSAGLEGLPTSASDIINADTPCSYLQVSMPTQFSGLVTNTGVTPSEGDVNSTFEFKRRDGSVVNYRKLTPAVLCSDASFNLMDEFSRADTTLNDMEIRFGFMPEILEAIAKFKGLEVSDVIKTMNAKTTSNGNNGTNTTTVDRATGDVITVKGGVAFPTHAVESASSTSNEWGVNGVMQGRSVPLFLFNNPSGAASVNGVPVTREGELLAALKRGRAAGKIDDISEEEFGKGVLSEGALRAVGDKTLSSDLKPLKEGWDRLVKLQKVFTTTANNLRESVEKNTIKDAEAAKKLAKSIVDDFKILQECKNFIRDMTSRIVASSDLVTGGYGGDPSMALVAPYRSENMGVIGAVSGGINMGIGSLMASKSLSIEALRTAMEEQITLNSKRGREMPEHSGIRYVDGEELISDADSLFRGVVDKSPSSSSILHRVVENLVRGLEPVDRLRQRAFEDVKPSMDSEENKRHAIIKLLSENHDLLVAIANTMYFGSDQDVVALNNRRGVNVIDETKYQQRVKYDTANKDGLNALFNTR